MARQSGCVSLSWLLAIASVCTAPAVARADERVVTAEVAAGAPFDAAQLTAAIRIRMPTGRAPVRVRVFAILGGVRIETRGNARDVALGALTGAAAARLVALSAGDLLLDDLATAPQGSADSTVSSLGASVEARRATSRSSTTVSALGGAAAWSHVLGGLGFDVAASSGTWLVAVEAGGATLVGGPLRLTAATLRIGGGARVGPVELRSSATFVPLIVDDGAGDRTVLLGAGASARLRVPLTSSVRGVVACGIDVFATRTAYISERMSVLTTPRVSPWIAAGLEVTP